MTRNPLDVHMSILKHQQADAEGGQGALGSHCTADDQTCLSAHKKTRVTIDANGLVTKLQQLQKEDEETHHLLNSHHVRYLHLAYDDVFAGEAGAMVRASASALHSPPCSFGRAFCMKCMPVSTAF